MFSEGVPFKESFDRSVLECGAVLLLDENAVARKELEVRLAKGIDRLKHFIQRNGLTFYASEKEYSCEWKGKSLAARVDMILIDSVGNPVILDFKNTSVPTSYENRVAQNRALQLAVYEYVVLKSGEFAGKAVRKAYVILPDAEIFTSDEFEMVSPIAPADKGRVEGDLMELLGNSFDFRWRQLGEGIVELGENLPVDVTEYGKSQSEKRLYPIKEGEKGIKCDNSYSNVKGLR